MSKKCVRATCIHYITGNLCELEDKVINPSYNCKHYKIHFYYKIEDCGKHG